MDPCIHGKPDLGSKGCAQCDREWTNLKRRERAERMYPGAVFTCASCDYRDSCPVAWDSYNQGGDCLLDK